METLAEAPNRVGGASGRGGAPGGGACFSAPSTGVYREESAPRTSRLSRAAPPPAAPRPRAGFFLFRLPSALVPASSVMATRSPSVVVSNLARGDSGRPARHGTRNAGSGQAWPGKSPGLVAATVPGVRLYVTSGRRGDGMARREWVPLLENPGKACERNGEKWRVGRLVCRLRAHCGERPWANLGMIWRGEGEALLGTFWGWW